MNVDKQWQYEERRNKQNQMKVNRKQLKNEECRVKKIEKEKRDEKCQCNRGKGKEKMRSMST